MIIVDHSSYFILISANYLIICERALKFLPCLVESTVECAPAVTFVSTSVYSSYSTTA